MRGRRVNDSNRLTCQSRMSPRQCSLYICMYSIQHADRVPHLPLHISIIAFFLPRPLLPTPYSLSTLEKHVTSTRPAVRRGRRSLGCLTFPSLRCGAVRCGLPIRAASPSFVARPLVCGPRERAVHGGGRHGRRVRDGQPPLGLLHPARESGLVVLVFPALVFSSSWLLGNGLFLLTGGYFFPAPRSF